MEKTQEELAAVDKVAAEEAGRIKLAVDDMEAMGMPPEEIEKELAKRQPAKKEEVKQDDKNAVIPEDKKKEEVVADKVKTEKATADKIAADKVLDDLLFAKSRDVKFKANEEAAKIARETRLASMTPEEKASEDKRYEEALEVGRQQSVELVTYKQNDALAKIRESMPVDEWALLTPTLEELVASKTDYDDVIFDGKGGFKQGVDYAKHIADLVARAKGANLEKILELRLAKKEADMSVKIEIDNLPKLSGPKQPPDKTTPKSELDILKERALAGLQTSAEAERLVELMDKE